MKSALVAVLAAFLIQGCANVTRFESPTAGTTLAVRGYQPATLPHELSLDSKATGQHEFVATTPGGKSLYGILPLSVNGGTMAASILFFAPALFIAGFRDVFPFYQMDPEGGVIRYKSKAEEEWRVYQPLAVESARAKATFDKASGS
jgi:hypothetical protein